MPKATKSPSTPAALVSAAPYIVIGGVFTGCMVLGVALGYWLDTLLATEPWMLLCGSLFGMGCGFYHFFKVVLRPSLKKQDTDKGRHDAER